MKHIVDHKIFSFDYSKSHNFGKIDEKRLVKLINLNDVFARIVTSVNGKISAEHKLEKIKNTPHFDYVLGKKENYAKYLDSFTWAVGLGIDHSEEIFNNLINSFNPTKYLSNEYSDSYILCQKISDKIVICDGLHRASILLKGGYTQVPAIVIDQDEKFDQLHYYLNDFKDDFLEWYTPIKIGNHIIHERTYPNFIERQDYLTNSERGESKWNFIIKNNLPNVKDKTVCDVGCNSGLFSYYMAKLGAKNVDGFDRSEVIVQPTNPYLPRQNVVQQAYFVKNMMQLHDNQKYDNLNFYEFDINKANFENFKYDIFYSSCVLYHFGDKFEKFVEQISKNNNFIFLQTNLGHKGDLEKYSSIEHHKFLLEKYGYDVKIDAPSGYNYPVILGSK